MNLRSISATIPSTVTRQGKPSRNSEVSALPTTPRSQMGLDVQKARVKTLTFRTEFLHDGSPVGYSRVPTSDQDWSLQLEALTKAGVATAAGLEPAPLSFEG